MTNSRRLASHGAHADAFFTQWARRNFVSLLQLDLSVKVVVLNNGTLGFVEPQMKAGGLVDTQVSI